MLRLLSLTILYYEVVRHFRVVTEFVGRRPALLTDIHGGIADFVSPPIGRSHYEIDWQVISDNRKLLEATLLDDRYKEGFDTVARRLHRSYIDQANGQTGKHKLLPLPPVKATEGVEFPNGPKLRFFEFEMKTGGVHAALAEGQVVHVFATLLWTGITLESSGAKGLGSDKTDLVHHGAFAFDFTVESFVGKVPERTVKNADGTESKSWTVFAGEIDMIQLYIAFEEVPNMSFEHITIKGVDTYGNRHDLVDKSYASGNLVMSNNGTIDLPTLRPQPIPGQPGRTTAEVEEDAKFLEFNDHLLNNRAHYERALRLGSTETQRAFELANVSVGNGASLLEKVENRPLEVLGDYVAYPCIDGAWSGLIMSRIKELELPEPPPVERLVTLPTRGVFSEAKLGHCNSSEEIDPNRFWKWEEHPIPHMAPDIAPIQGVTPQPQTQNLSPTPFPQSLINIVNPPNAPDPNGLASAMNVLAASNIFRDMSGRAEVADLLKKLSDNSVAIADVAQKAATGGVSKPPATDNGTGTRQPSASPTVSGQNQSDIPPKQTPEQKEKQQLENQDKKLDIAEKLPPPQKKQVQKAVVDELKKPSIKERTIEISLKGYANRIIVGQWAWELFRKGQSLGFRPMEQYPDGRIKIKFNDEIDDNRFRLEVTGEVLSGYGVNAQILGRDIDLVIPAELYKTRDYYYVTLNATTGTFKTTASSSEEVTNKFAQEYKLTPEVGYKSIIKVTGEGGWTWEKEEKKSAGREMEMEVTFYAGGFTVATIN